MGKIQGRTTMNLAFDSIDLLMGIARCTVMSPVYGEAGLTTKGCSRAAAPSDAEARRHRRAAGAIIAHRGVAKRGDWFDPRGAAAPVHWRSRK